MICWSCELPAKGVCIFCGRGVCEPHAQKKPNILAVYDEVGDHPKALIVKNALFCAVCEPMPKPIVVPELE